MVVWRRPGVGWGWVEEGKFGVGGGGGDICNAIKNKNKLKLQT